MTKPVCHIVCAGPCDRLDISLEEGDLLIAADGGYAHCVRDGLEPDLYVGDMDSLPESYADSMTCERVVLPVDKDDTDTLTACKIGLIRGFSEFRIHAALGGDVGHEIANIQALAFLSRRMSHGVLLGRTQSAHLVTAPESPMTFSVTPGTRVSVFSYGDAAEGVYERGLYWELEDALLTAAEPIGVSNRAREDSFELSVRKGALLVIIG